MKKSQLSLILIIAAVAMIAAIAIPAHAYRLVWDPSDGTVDTYDIYRASEDVDASYVKVISVPGNQLEFDLDYIPAQGETFYFRVKAVNSAGESDWSNTAIYTFDQHGTPIWDSGDGNLQIVQDADGSISINVNQATINVAQQQ